MKKPMIDDLFKLCIIWYGNIWMRLSLWSPVPIIFWFSFFYYHIKYHVSNTLKIKRDINQQDLNILDLHFVKSE